MSDATQATHRATGTNVANPLTTPYVYPNGCLPQPTLTTSIHVVSSEKYSATWLSVAGRHSQSFSTSPTTFTSTYVNLVLDPAHTGFASCQPGGWSGSFNYSPAVCPSNWVAQSMGTSEVYSSSMEKRTFSTAYCCPSGFDLKESHVILSTHHVDYPLHTACVQKYGKQGQTDSNEITLSAPNISANPQITMFTEGVVVLPPWHITWEASDTANMSPMPPALTRGELIPTWTPGMDITPYEWLKSRDPKRCDGLCGYEWFIAVAIVIPILVGAGIIACVARWCVVKRRRKKEKKLLDVVLLQELPIDSHVDPTGRTENQLSDGVAHRGARS